VTDCAWSGSSSRAHVAGEAATATANAAETALQDLSLWRCSTASVDSFAVAVAVDDDDDMWLLL
jgi:hypothetical protein